MFERVSVTALGLNGAGNFVPARVSRICFSARVRVSPGSGVLGRSNRRLGSRSLSDLCEEVWNQVGQTDCLGEHHCFPFNMGDRIHRVAILIIHQSGQPV